MEYLDSILKKIDEQKEEMLQTLQELIAIPSVVGPAEGDMPFGQEVHRAFRYMLDKAAQDGFSCVNVDNYGGHIDLPAGGGPDVAGADGGSGRIMGIVGHLDVVPEGSGWDVEPYGGEIREGRLYGRGAIDDKGPVIAAYYAMKAVKACGIPLKDTVRLVLGLDEETDWNGMTYYLARTEAPDYGFTPDGDFPAIHGEKGILVFDLAKKFAAAGTAAKGLELRSLKGGNAANMVPDHVRAVLRDTAGSGYEEIREKAAAFRAEKQVKINCRGVGKSLEITIAGISAHGAKPEMGLNAISLMMEFLSRLNFVNEDVNEFIGFYCRHIGYELNGQALGCGFCDEPSGSLVLNTGVIRLDPKAATLTVNVRYPVTMEAEQIYDSMMPVLDKYGLGVVKGKHEEPIYIPADDPMIVTLMDIYRRQTGDADSRPLVIGGGTYARAMKNVIAFGARFPDEPELGHQKNEYIDVDSLMRMTKIYGEAIFRLAGEKTCHQGGQI